jgi:ubiquitin C-terminal hydrolase
VSEREEPFFALSLAVKNKKSVAQSLATLTSGEMLQGDNAYFCEKCGRKVEALKRMCLKRLPNYLILVLKRFEFDLDSMTKQKVNDRCDIPAELDMEQFTQQGLRKREGTSSGD